MEPRLRTLSPAVSSICQSRLVLTSSCKLFSVLQKQGAFAEYAVTDTKAVARLPPGVSFEDAAGLPVAAMTALQGLIKGGLAFPNGHGRVLVQAASGGVGHYAVQVRQLIKRQSGN